MGKRFGIRNERGFSLVELLTVIMIMGILTAIAVPTFVGSKRNGQDAMAQTSLRTALSAQRTYYVDYQTYTIDATTLKKIESQLSFTTTDAKQSGVMGALGGTPANQAVVLVSTSESGNQFCLMNIATALTAGVNGQTQPGTYYKKNTAKVTTPPTAVATTQCGPSGYLPTEAGW